jgi:uncharacterized protein
LTTRSRSVAAYPSAPYVVPFVVFVALLGLPSILPAPPLADAVIRLVLMTAVILLIARPALDFSLKAPVSSVLLGVVVFAIWIAPDLLFPGYRHELENAITGVAKSSMSPAALASAPVLTLRTVRAVVIVPIVEELFWRAWMMRWIISPNFRKIPLGTYSALSFWTVAVLFASEHGPYWDVGLAAGILYNWWMVRTRSLGDLILTHAVTNACLCAYVIAAGKWEYWL